MSNIEMSTLNKTWIFDLDGTLVKHNGYKSKEEVLPGVKKFFSDNVKQEDKVIFMTARTLQQASTAIETLSKDCIVCDHLITDLPHGERIMYNDKKNSGLKTCYAFNVNRNAGLEEKTFIFSK
tara:strand:- start:176 stop:544 length:369 start_codon:yes stop_codon:yes gene_type:complete